MMFMTDSKKLTDLLNESSVILNLVSRNKADAINELSERACANVVGHQHLQELLTAVWKREGSMSTGVGFGIGIPHAALDMKSCTTAVVGISKEGLDFQALDGNPVHIIILFVTEKGNFQKHLHTLASIAKVLRDADVRKRLETATSANDVLAALASV